MFPYFKVAAFLPGDFQPIIAYLFTEWKCNLDCHYCWSYDNRIKGMTEDTARRAIDWLESTPCRVLAPTGGEAAHSPGLRSQGGLLTTRRRKISGCTWRRNARPSATRSHGPTRRRPASLPSTSPWIRSRKKAGASEKPFEHVARKLRPPRAPAIPVRLQPFFFNTNICRTNIDDVKELATHSAHEKRDIHHLPHQRSSDDGAGTLQASSRKTTPTSGRKIFQPWDDLLDWLIDKQRQGWKMVGFDSPFAEHEGVHARGRRTLGMAAPGQNWLIIRTNGTLAPCFSPCTNASYDWGTVANQKFDVPATFGNEKKAASRIAFSTLGYKRCVLLQRGSA